jgi:hypothetical protein
MPSCKKSNVITETPILLKSISKLGDTCSTFCTYDNQNRLLTAIQCNIIESYQYLNDSIIYRRTIDGNLDYQYTYLLNSKGIATSYIRYDNTSSTSLFSYEYDVNSFRTSWKDMGNNVNHKEYEIQNNNTVTETSASISSSGNYVISLLYFLDQKNTLGNKNLGRIFLGSSSENLKKAENWSTASGDFTQQFSYDKDDKNRVIKRVTRLNGVDTTEVRFYTYF